MENKIYVAVNCEQAEQCVVRLITHAKVNTKSYAVRAQDVLSCIEQSLNEHVCTMEQVSGLFVQTGSGSFMAGRISVSAINGLAQSLSVPALSVEEIALLDFAECKQLLESSPIDIFAITKYASEPNIRVKQS